MRRELAGDPLRLQSPAEPAAQAKRAQEEDRGPAAVADVGGAGWEAACAAEPGDFPATTTPPTPTTGTPDLVLLINDTLGANLEQELARFVATVRAGDPA